MIINDVSPTDREELRRSLEIIEALGENKEVTQLLASMNKAAALAAKVEILNGISVKTWFAHVAEGFADYIVFKMDDLDALLAQRFLDGEIAFMVIRHPDAQIWWRRVEGPAWRKPN